MYEYHSTPHTNSCLNLRNVNNKHTASHNCDEDVKLKTNDDDSDLIKTLDLGILHLKLKLLISFD